METGPLSDDDDMEEGHLCYMQNVEDETLIEDGTNNDPYKNEDDGDNVADNDDDEQASTPKKTTKRQDKEDIVQ
uniref:Uncharacterized protein n=1 Tax=Romanomermis culicivorax TaxID=13658 RepID=A0A915JK46_ROMCU